MPLRPGVPQSEHVGLHRAYSSLCCASWLYAATTCTLPRRHVLATSGCAVEARCRRRDELQLHTRAAKGSACLELWRAEGEKNKLMFTTQNQYQEPAERAVKATETRGTPENQRKKELHYSRNANKLTVLNFSIQGSTMIVGELGVCRCHSFFREPSLARRCSLPHLQL